VNNSYDVGAHNEHEDVFQRDGSTSETRNEGDEKTPVREGLYPRHVRRPTPDVADDEHVRETVKILREQHRKIMNHLSRQDQVMTESKQALSVASSNSNGGVRIPPSVPANQIVQRIGNDTPREEFNFNQIGDTGSGSENVNNANDPFETEHMIFMRDMNERMEQNAKEFHALMDHVPVASPVLNGTDSKKYTQLPF